MKRVPFQTLQDELYRVLASVGFTDERAMLCARLFAENQRDGVYSHGLNRFPGFVAGLESKQINFRVKPEKIESFGALERWDGKMGVGLVNAHFCMQRATELANIHGIGCVGLSNTNHWMRGGAYALQAAEAGHIGICWTNTTRLMPPWGSGEKKIGNNPMAIGIPREGGHILLDMAMSQYSNGKLEVLQLQGKELPLPGGYNTHGELTVDPGEILDSARALPIGYWKGSGLALVLDTMASLISGGQATHDIGKQGSEYAVSQVYIAMNAIGMMGQAALNEKVTAIIDDFHTSVPLDENESVRYPGEGMLRTRQESLEKGVLVDETQWQGLLKMNSS
ncbi:MAG: 3-dehydro-L-gulonate 2-dehydrogenase [Candidatus Poribacteria bacterium]|nr:3-dehydro-L-gulonate 2-dehydrogenase [Candidatus Poribacteria bacterium]MYK17222.1 3-dehydro-L-gulonate 2-dehydrogenase [Candidatus Poribacteria bacterium]